MSEKKYQIFISSTYNDLKKERAVAIRAILEMSHVPVGMEMFSAADEEQWEIIKRTIDQCDYYLVIVAHRYGSLDVDISFTEKEYDYAISSNIPVLGFIIHEDAVWAASLVDKKKASLEALNLFKEKVRKKHVNFWRSAEDLYGQIPIALIKQFNSSPRPGWIRADKHAGPQVLAEITRLSNENSKLRTQVDSQIKMIEEEKKAEYITMRKLLRKNMVHVHFFIYRDKWSTPYEMSLFTIFWILAPEIIIEQSSKELSSVIGVSLNKTDKDLRASWPVPSNSIRSWLADYLSLGLVEPSPKKHLLKDQNEYWTLSQKGKEFYYFMRRERLEKESLKDELPQSDEPNNKDG